jgi:cytochrome c556
MKKTLCLLAVAGGFATLGAPAYAQFNKPEDAIRYRQSAFVLMGNNMGRINGQLKASTPNVQAIQQAAATVEFASKLPYEAFIPGSESGGTPPTRAKPEVFKDTDKIKQLAEKMQGEVAKLNTAAKTGDINAIRAAFGDAGKSCKACHDDYRKE